MMVIVISFVNINPDKHQSYNKIDNNKTGIGKSFIVKEIIKLTKNNLKIKLILIKLELEISYRCNR